MSTIHKLTELFARFPGIGPRQAKRFVYFLLTKNGAYLDELSQLILMLKKDVSTCSSCYRFFSTNGRKISVCGTCSDRKHEENMLMIVERDADYENIERSGVYHGKYFILGGSVPILEKNPEQKVRTKELLKTVEERAKTNILKEIILAFAINPTGENTTDYITKTLFPLRDKYSLKISTLGRGLSTGTELEYPDTETIKNALKNRA